MHLKLTSFLMMTTVLSSTPFAVRAQNAEAPAQQLPTVTVESDRAASDGYQVTEPSLYKLTGPLVDTPISITPISRELMDDQGTTTVTDALRNVPGVSIAAGEGGNQGNSLTIRGFSARSDFFLDGMRDFGSYYRDPFNMESIEVLKGPDSLLFGRGSTGGVVNQVSKQPELYDENTGTFAFGSDLTRRATADINKKVDEHTAIRFNAMGQDGNVAGRDGVENSRYGLAPSIAFGIGTPTRLTVDYFHQSESDIPDYGLPWFYNRPAHVDRENFYGFAEHDQDYLKTDADIGTAKFEHDFNTNYTIRNQLRLAAYNRSVRITEPRIPATPSTTPLDTITVTRNEITAESTETYIGNQTDLTSRFATGDIKHTLVTGLEFAHETSTPTRYSWAGVPGTNLVDPSWGDQFTGTRTETSHVDANADSVALYAIDTLSLDEHWDLIGGARWDYVESYYDQTVLPVSHFTRTDSMPSWRAGIVYKPVENGSIYFSSGTSFNPSVEQLSLSAANADAPPEESIAFELGTKWELFDKRLLANFAVFRDEKTNARTQDPANPLLNVVSGDQRVDGFEIGATGHITDKWQVAAGYAFMSTKVVKSNNPAEQGNQLANAPKHTFNLFSTYILPWQNLEVGGGMNAVSSRNSSTTPDATSGVMETAPGYVTFDAMAKLPITERVALQLNVYNLLDKYYFDQIHPGHVVPGPARTVLLTTSVKF
ncbi:MAG: TonB-dependent receptor [Bdellovibrionales bacterium]